MAKVLTQEERKKRIKGQVVDLVRQSGRETLKATGGQDRATRYLMSILARVILPTIVDTGYSVNRLGQGLTMPKLSTSKNPWKTPEKQ